MLYSERAEATLNCEKIKAVALAIVELCLAEGIYIFFFSGSQQKIPFNM